MGRYRRNRKILNIELHKMDAQLAPPAPLSEVEEEVKIDELKELLGTIRIPSLVDKKTGEFMRARSRKPTIEQCEQLGTLVAIGLRLEEACSLLTPPLKPLKVERSIVQNSKCKLVYTRSISKWKYFASRYIITHPKESMGLAFILKTRHSREYGAKVQVDVLSGGVPLQLTSPEVIARAREYALQESKAKAIDVEEVKQISGVSEKVPDIPVEAKEPKAIFKVPERPAIKAIFEAPVEQKVYLTKEEKDKQRAEAYLQSLIDNGEQDETVKDQ